MWNTKLGTCCYTSPSGYQVYQNWGYRWLTLGSSALQTVINRRAPHRPILHYIPALTLLARQRPGKTALLGLGGAGVAHFLLKKVSCSLVAIEVSGEIIQIAQEFFMTNTLPNLMIVQQNAVDFVQKSQESFQHLLIDLYNANHFPPECATEDFFQHCKNKVHPDGFMAVNLANSSEQLTLLNHIRKQFSHTLVIPIKRSANIVILASAHGSKESFINKIKENQEVKEINCMDVWGYVGYGEF